MGKDLLDVAMKELVHSEKYKSMKIKGSQGHLYKRDGPYFWNAFYIEEGSPLNGTQKVRINISLKYWRFDELQWTIIHPWMEQKFTDKLRCNSGAMCRAHIEMGAQFFTWEATEPVWKGKHEDLLILAESILEYILERVRSTIETAEKEFGSLGEYFIAHPEINPRLSGLSYIDKGDYQGAKEVFSSIETLNEGFYIRPETPEDLARMRSNAPEKDKEKMVFWRDYRDIYIDYCIAMLQGIPWTRDIVALGMPK